MTEIKNLDEKIAAAAKAAFSDKTVPPPDKLWHRLRIKTRELYACYMRVGGADRHPPWEEWLCDNYYVLEKESKQAARDLRLLAKRSAPEELARFYALFFQVLAGARPPVCDETITAILREAARYGSISEKQFSFVPTAIKAALVELAHRACLQEKSGELMGYAVTGLIRLGAVDMESIIHGCSSIEAVLLQDPAGVYGQMTGESRRHYRRLIAQIAAKTGVDETTAAKSMLASCQQQQGVRAHIGYPILTSTHITGPRRRRGRLAVGLGVLLPFLVAMLLGWLCRSPWVSVLTYLPLWEILRTVIQHFAMAGVEVDFIPRMNLKKLRDKPKTVVLVSTLLPKAADAYQLKDRLEQLFFSNSDPDMYYCILADLGEWPYPTDEKDESQIAATRKVIEGLNLKHGRRFMLFLRARSYNKTQNKYSGWERKRGAITEFVRYLKGERVSLHTFVGDAAILPDIRFIVALDADTSLLYESAQTLVSAAIHPMNRPVADEDGVVREGYGILAPKISTDLDSARKTPFSRVMTGCGGVTAYDTKDKDFYQDLFGDSIFAGKGLIDVDCFHALLSRRFPENQILSHDILEGAYLRVGFVSDAEMTDGAPSGMLAWLARLHRWQRGDWQNLRFIGSRYRAEGKAWENPIGNLSKYRLFDNLRRSFTPISALLCVLAAAVTPRPLSWVLALCGILAVTFSSLWAAFFSLLGGGLFTVSRKFFTRTLPHTLELIAQGAFRLIMLPAQALVTADAAIRALWRTFVSHKKMLEWQTAAQSDGSGGMKALLCRFWLPELFAVAYLVWTLPSPICLLGLVFALVMPVAWYSARLSSDDPGGVLTGAQRDTLISYNAAMWRYYEEFADQKNNYLPPDNIQQSPVFRVAARTSPTNIGMQLLSVLAARDFDFIDTAGLYERVERTIATVESLPKWNGNLYNWYDTETLETLKPEFVSTVDSGNFICCMVALAQGLSEFAQKMPAMAGLIARIERIVEECDLTVFYNRKKHLFSIGYDMPDGGLVGSHYDFLMSEARLTSYYAVARKTVGKRHWGTLNRTMSRCGSYAGAVSWTGTMFEYFMPHLLLPVYEGSLLSEALTYCLYCQKKRVKSLDVPWGISESAFYAFDNNLNYQYKAHGVQKLGVKRYLDKELVISPYSTFITIPFNPNSSMENLQKLRELGVYGRYGFYEAVDFTAERVGAGSLSVTRSYMAHHIGMSMVASCNAVFENRMQKRFMRDPYMHSAKEFLQEKIAKNTVVYDELTNSEARGEKHERPKLHRDESGEIYPQAPRCTLLTNGELTDVLTDSGMGYLKFGETDLTRREEDLLRRGQGLLVVARMGGKTIPATLAPFYDQEAQYSVEYQEHSVTYFARRKEAEVGVRCMVHPTISCEQRQIVLKNQTGQKQSAQVLVYLEPTLCRHRDYSAHPAYSKLFVQSGYNPENKTLTFCRRGRDSTVDLYLTVGFLQDVEFVYETRREALMSAPGGTRDLLRFWDKSFSCADTGAPDACCALKFDLLMGAGGQAQATLLLCASRTLSEGVAGIINMRSAGLMDQKTAAKSPLLGDSLEGRLGSALLGQLLYPQAGRAVDPAARRQNSLGQSGLWCTGVSGDLPIALVELDREFDPAMLGSYLRLHRTLRGVQVEFDLVILYTGGEEQRCRLLELVTRCHVNGILGSRGGVFVLDKYGLSPELVTLLHAVARHTAAGALPATPPIPFRPAEWRAVSPVAMPGSPELRVEGGAFHQGRFYVDKESPLPYCHVLASPVFGTLVSDRALGFTWAINARENKLTPWYNDICTDNRGELLLLSDGASCWDLCNGARASFSAADAFYEAKTAGLHSSVRVTVAAKGFAKYLDVTLENTGAKPRELQLAYYLEPVLAVTRETARCIRCERRGREDILLLHNPYNTAVQCHAALTARGDGLKELCFTSGRAAFLCGDWSPGDIAPDDDPCAAAIATLRLAPGENRQLRFVLSYGMTADSALEMARRDLPAQRQPEETIRIHTPNEAVNQYINHFAPHQILACRIHGRTAFYQCGGAYGFRDQLQDSTAWLLLDPEITRRQILRCCAVQFEEGDVLHWWHPLPQNAGGLRGVRTRFSDDLLWLPYAVCEYVEKTGNADILSVSAPYLSAPELSEKEHERYIPPGRSSLREDVYSHCARAIDRAWRLDERGLPLIGCGDWNDGFSAVGLGGKGSSVWLALFMACVLERFAPLCALRGEADRAEEYRRRAAGLKAAVDAHCWDGGWYVRAFFDNGEPMGASGNEECRIDLLPQSFAVFAGMPDRQRVEQGLRSACKHLYDRKLRLARLFTPPFQHSRQQPGYVKAYPGGIRENGGQYTHAAIWFAMALLEGGLEEEGAELLQMLCPADRALHKGLAAQYKLEPYYMAADIYVGPGAPGRGGWSMYTGAASWYYRAVVEVLLGVKRVGDKLLFRPRLPAEWAEVSLELTLRGTRIQVRMKRGQPHPLTCDGAPADSVPLDGGSHTVVVGV